MENPRIMAEIIKEAKKIEENNLSNMSHFDSIDMLLSSNDLGNSKDKELSKKFDKLSRQMEDINKITSDLLSDLAIRHN
ncbi:MAG: hypothetical protein WCZ27_06345 [Tissierellaceae bacterium]